MANRLKTMYASLANRFAHLALGAKEEDEEDKDERAEDEPEDRDEDAAEEDPKERKKASRKGKTPKKGRADEEDEEDSDEEARAEEDDEDEDEEDEKKDERKAGARAERARWAAVMSSPEAKGRVPLACSLLTDTNMSADKVLAALAASPVDAKHGLAARMASIPRVDIGSASSGTPAPSTPAARAAEIVKAYNKTVG